MVKELSDTKFIEYLERKVRDTIRKYKLFTKQNKVAVAVSGGKDSTVCLYILKKLGYDVEAITIDARIGNYTEENVKNIKKVCKDNKIKLHIIDFRKEFGMSLCYIKSILKSKGCNHSSCMICGILKRYLLNKYSRLWEFDALATGHNLDDEAQAFVMNVFRNDIKLASRQGPSTGFKKSIGFVKRVKPLYLISESEVIRYSQIKDFPVNYGICPCSVGAYRRTYLNMLNDFEKKNPSVKYNIIRFQESIMNYVDKEKISSGNALVCTSCGEPSASDTCNACKIFKQLKIKV
jgi:tRNA-5-methyluridine54 2-sulfurtransferase